MAFPCTFLPMQPLTVSCLLVIAFLAATPVSGLKIAVADVPNELKLNTEYQSNSTSRMFSLTENIKRLTRSMRALYSLTFTSTSESNKVLGARCEKLSDCSGVEFAICDNQKCTCDSNHTVSTEHIDKCLKGVSLGEHCQEDVQCQKGDLGSVCVGYKCICSMHHSEKNGTCISKPKLGSVCEENVDCKHMPFAECIDNVCGCPDALLPGKNLDVCLQVASPDVGAHCQEDIQCSAQYGDESRCIMGYCECDHSYHSSGGKCVPDLTLGSPCSSSSDCIVSRHTEEGNNRDCFNSTCSCAVGYKSVNEENFCVKAGDGYQLHASLAWLLCIFVVPYLH